MTFEEWWPTAPASSSSDWAGATKDYARFGWDAGYKASEEEFYAPLGAEPLPPVMLEALDITRKAVAAQIESEAVALVRELNDALVIPKGFQARVDAVLDRSEGGPDFNQERNAHADTIAAEHDSKREDKASPQK